MKRAKLKILNDNTPPPEKAQQVSPWNKSPNQPQNPDLQQIPTYRRQIVTKFLSNLRPKPKKQLNTIQPHQSPDTLNNSNERNAGSIKKMQGWRNSKTEGKEKEEQYQLYRIFKEDYQKKRKSKLKTTVINFNMEWEKDLREKKERFIRDQEENKRTFTRKLRLKEEIANKKNIERVWKKKSETVPNIFKNPFYLYQFGNVESSQNRNSLLFPSSAYQPSGSLKKRPSSESGLRVKTPYNLY